MKPGRRAILVYADWVGLGGAARLGTLTAAPARGKEVFSFEYDRDWLSRDGAQALDPRLGLFRGAQYPEASRENFGVFLDSCPDRWGRVLMRRREAHLVRQQARSARNLLESDYLLGVHDGHRLGALRFKLEPAGPFVDDDDALASPPWASLRELEHASAQLERDGIEDDPAYARWLAMLLAPGRSLGGARPKASVRDAEDRLWIAKFPSVDDPRDIGAWECVVHTLAKRAGVDVPNARLERFASRHHTFMSQRFDRVVGGRLHCASAMTMLERRDGEPGVSYLDLADALIQRSVQPTRDLQQLWRRVVFFIAVSNVDDHLRNHALLLSPPGWTLAPAYDMNPVPAGNGLTLNISDDDNSQDMRLAREVAPFFRLSGADAETTISEVLAVVRQWRDVAEDLGLPRAEREAMARAFRVADAAA